MKLSLLAALLSSLLCSCYSPSPSTTLFRGESKIEQGRGPAHAQSFDREQFSKAPPGSTNVSLIQWLELLNKSEKFEQLTEPRPSLEDAK